MRTWFYFSRQSRPLMKFADLPLRLLTGVRGEQVELDKAGGRGTRALVNWPAFARRS